MFGFCCFLNFFFCSQHRKGQWLRGDRTFNFYDVISGEELHYRKRHRNMKIYLMDGQEKSVLVDESASIRDVCAEICEKLRLEKPYEEWSLTLGSTRSFLDPVLGLQEQVERDMSCFFIFLIKSKTGRH